MLDWERLRTRANNDGEFLLHARFWNANVRIENGPDAYRMHIADGQIAAIEPWFGVIASDLSIGTAVRLVSVKFQARGRKLPGLLQ